MANLSDQQLAALLASVGWPQSQIPNALGVIGSESSGNPNVVAWGSGSTVLADSQGWPPPVSGYDEAAVGIFQDLISPASAVTPQSIAQLQNPVTNAAVGLGKYEAGGWSPWTGDAYVNAHPELLSQSPVPAGPKVKLTAAQQRQLAGLAATNPSTTAPNSSSNPSATLTSWWGDVLHDVGLGAGPLGLFNPAAANPGAAAQAVTGFSAKTFAQGLAEFTLAIFNVNSPAELGLRIVEVFAGAFLFAVGLFALVYAASGHTSSDLMGSAKSGAGLAARAL